MKNNFLDLPILNVSTILIIILGMTVIFPLIVLFGTAAIKNEDGITDDLRMDVGAALCLGLVIGFICVGIIFVSANNEDFPKVYNVQLVEKESVSEIHYSKKDEFKNGIINNLYIDNDKIFIIKDPKSDNYLLSHKKENLEDILTGTHRLSKPEYQTYSKEDVKKALENKVSEDKPQETAPSNVKENDFK